MGLDYMILHAILKNLMEELKSEDTTVERKRWVIMVGTFLLLSFVLALRGNETFMIESGSLVRGLPNGNHHSEQHPHVVIPLLGRFKNEEGERFHLMMSVSETASGFQVRRWVEYLAEVLKVEGRLSGPAFCDSSGNVLTSGEVDREFHHQLEIVREKEPHLIEAHVEISEKYSIFRSPRRGVTARAGEVGVPKNVIDFHNRWREVEQSGGRRASRSMQAYYTDLRLTKLKRLEFTRPL
jgi:hypothetical protein